MSSGNINLIIKKLFVFLLFAIATLISCEEKSDANNVETAKNGSIQKFILFYIPYSEEQELKKITLNKNDQKKIAEFIKNAKEISSDQRPKCKNIEVSSFVLMRTLFNGKEIEYKMSTCDVLMEKESRKYLHSEDLNDLFIELYKKQNSIE